MTILSENRLMQRALNDGVKPKFDWTYTPKKESEALERFSQTHDLTFEQRASLGIEPAFLVSKDSKTNPIETQGEDDTCHDIDDNTSLTDETYNVANFSDRIDVDLSELSCPSSPTMFPVKRPFYYTSGPIYGLPWELFDKMYAVNDPVDKLIEE